MVDNFTIEHYSTALILVYQDFETDKQTEFVSTLRQIYFAFKNNSKIIDVLSSRVISFEDKEAIIASFFQEESKNEINKQAYNFLVILCENNHFNNLLLILISFFEKIDVIDNFSYIRIFSPYKLDEQTLIDIKDIVSKKIKIDLDYVNIVDPNLIGGIKIKIDDYVFDYSIEGRINQLKKDLTKERY